MARDTVVKYSVYSVNVGLGIVAFVFSLFVTSAALTYYISSDRFMSKIINDFNQTLVIGMYTVNKVTAPLICLISRDLKALTDYGRTLIDNFFEDIAAAINEIKETVKKIKVYTSIIAAIGILAMFLPFPGGRVLGALILATAATVAVTAIVIAVIASEVEGAADKLDEHVRDHFGLKLGNWEHLEANALGNIADDYTYRLKALGGDVSNIEKHRTFVDKEDPKCTRTGI